MILRVLLGCDKSYAQNTRFTMVIIDKPILPTYGSQQVTDNSVLNVSPS
jgi:hypothetical protein